MMAVAFTGGSRSLQPTAILVVFEPHNKHRPYRRHYLSSSNHRTHAPQQQTSTVRRPPRDEETNETNPFCSPRSGLRRRAAGQVLLKKCALLFEGRVRRFPTRHHQRRRRVSDQEAEGVAHGQRGHRDDLRHRAAAGGKSRRSQDGSVCALQRDNESSGARCEGRVGVCGEVSSRRLAELFNRFDGSRKVYWDTTESNDLRLFILHDPYKYFYRTCCSQSST